MFTGLIHEIGHIVAIETEGETAELLIHAPALCADAKMGDSIAVNGACLTVSYLDAEHFKADISSETLQRTTFIHAQPGDPVNLEPALRLSDRLGGHMVSGHIDGVGSIERIEDDGEFSRLMIRFPTELARYIAEKGSICIDGISLTVTTVDDHFAGLAIIPTTLHHTTLRYKNPGDTINIEVDLIARYIERLLTTREMQKSTGLTIEKLREYGYHIDEVE
jgi:riboflavin synthase